MVNDYFNLSGFLSVNSKSIRNMAEITILRLGSRAGIWVVLWGRRFEFVLD
ncbi:rCG24706 [Rattus norvegicus]|uniref:RCG24706 n=1 Tax=Rattus norvegicus TaxID=10116 RepID=A6JCJ9_RAT|nr:rCG24706 [Rattus norvegicus]